jgi:hypothetical protein
MDLLLHIRNERGGATELLGWSVKNLGKVVMETIQEAIRIVSLVGHFELLESVKLKPPIFP